MPCGFASQMGKHMSNSRDVRASRDCSGCPLPSRLIWGFEGRHSQKQATEARGLPKVARLVTEVTATPASAVCLIG